jgi:hypothetical protein
VVNAGAPGIASVPVMLVVTRLVVTIVTTPGC